MTAGETADPAWIGFPPDRNAWVVHIDARRFQYAGKKISY
jgi:hypothetical protein